MCLKVLLKLKYRSIPHIRKERFLMKKRGFEICKDYIDKDINLPVRKTKNSVGYDIEAAEDIIIHLCTNEKNGYGIDLDKLSKEEVLKLVNVRYAISLNSYQKYIPTTIASDVSDETVAVINATISTASKFEISVANFSTP